MDAEAARRRYALALALVPEPNAAGDLLLSARNEAALRRQAAAWRRRHGLPPPTAEPGLPELTPEQAELAQRLWRRRRQGRRLRPLLLLAALLAIGAAATLQARPATPTGLAASPAFAAPAPPDGSGQSNRLTLTLHQAEATPTTVTLWWSVVGAGAGRLARALAPELYTPNSGIWLEPDSTERLAAGRDRLLGLSRYKALPLPWRTARVRAAAPDGGPGWELQAPLQRDPDPAAHTYTLDRSADLGLFRVRVESVSVGADYTLLRYVYPSQPAPIAVFYAGSDGQAYPLDPYGPVALPEAPGDETEALYRSVPAGARTLLIRFQLGGERVAFSLNGRTAPPSPGRPGASAVLPPMPGVTAVKPLTATATDGKTYGHLWVQPQDGGWLITAPDAPATARLVSLMADIFGQAPEVRVDLTP